MDISAEKNLIFSGAVDFDFLAWLRVALLSNETLELIMQFKGDLEASDDTGRFQGPISKEALIRIMDEQATNYLTATGEEVPDEELIRVLTAQDRGISYILPPCWVPAVLASAITDAASIEEARDILGSLMVDGYVPDGMEILSNHLSDPGIDLLIDLDTASVNYERARRAGEIVRILNREFNLGL